MPSAELASFAGKRVVIWGYGREGRAAVHALENVPVASLSVIDDGDPVANGDVQVVAGAEADRALACADIVIKSPGVSKYDPRARALVERGARLTGGSALWMSAHAEQTVAVTGSKGKSTTSALVSHLANVIGIPNVYGGNIGTPLLDLAHAEQYVVELSSYQCSELTVSPDIAVITSLFPEHLNWHGSEQQYYSDKLNLVAHNPGTVIYNATDSRLAPMAAMLLENVAETTVIRVGVDESAPHVRIEDGREWLALEGRPLAPRDSLRLLGTHNTTNACLALAAVRVLAQRRGTDLIDLRAELHEGLRSFTPLPHRLTLIAEEPATGLRFIDDSLSTAPQAAIAALEALPEGELVLIVGGQDRGVDYRPLREHLAASRREIITVIGIPASGPRILAELAGLSGIRTVLAADLAEAVEQSRSALPDGGTVLLSPAAPSYGTYANYEARGEAFAAAVAATAG